MGTLEYFDYILKKRAKLGLGEDVKGIPVSLRSESQSSKLAVSTNQPQVVQTEQVRVRFEGESEEGCDPFDNICNMSDE